MVNDDGYIVSPCHAPSPAATPGRCPSPVPLFPARRIRPAGCTLEPTLVITLSPVGPRTEYIPPLLLSISVSLHS